MLGNKIICVMDKYIEILSNTQHNNNIKKKKP